MKPVSLASLMNTAVEYEDEDQTDSLSLSAHSDPCTVFGLVGVAAAISTNRESFCRVRASRSSCSCHEDDAVSGHRRLRCRRLRRQRKPANPQRPLLTSRS